MYTILCRELREIEDLASRRHTSQETAMAKAKKRIVARKKKLETRQGQRQACAQEGCKTHDAEKGKV